MGEVGKVMIKDIPFKGKKEYKVIDMPFGKTLTYWGDMDAKLEDGRTLSIQILGYLYLKADKFVVCTFTTSNGKLPKLKETFEKIMKSAKHQRLLANCLGAAIFARQRQLAPGNVQACWAKSKRLPVPFWLLKAVSSLQKPHRLLPESPISAALRGT